MTMMNGCDMTVTITHIEVELVSITPNVTTDLNDYHNKEDR